MLASDLSGAPSTSTTLCAVTIIPPWSLLAAQIGGTDLSIEHTEDMIYEMQSRLYDPHAGRRGSVAPAPPPKLIRPAGPNQLDEVARRSKPELATCKHVCTRDSNPSPLYLPLSALSDSRSKPHARSACESHRYCTTSRIAHTAVLFFPIDCSALHRDSTARNRHARLSLSARQGPAK